MALSLLGFLLSQTIAQQPSAALVISLADTAGNTIVDAEAKATDADKRQFDGKLLASGDIDFAKLKGGEYKLVVKAKGFRSYETAVQLKPGETKRLNLVLELAEIDLQVNVDRTDVADVNTHGDTTDLSDEEIKSLPDDPAAMLQVIKQLAGDSPTGEDPQITVNGVPGAPVPNKNDIKMVRINRNVFSAQYEGQSGAGIEIFTNNTAKKITGYIGGELSDYRFGATDPYLQRRVPSQARSVYWGISGPLGKKTVLSVNGNASHGYSSSVVNATVIDSGFHLSPFRSSYFQPGHNDRVSLSVNSDPNKKHKLYAQYSLFVIESQNSGIGGFTLAERANHLRNQDNSLAFSDTFIKSSNAVNTLRFFFRRSENALHGSSTAGPAINVQDAFFGGASPSDQDVTTSRVELYDDVTRKMGRWSIGVGAMLRVQHITEDTRTNFNGTYSFNGKTAPLLDVNNTVVTDSSGNPVLIEITSIESYRRNVLFRSLGYSASQIRALGGGADQFSIAGGDPLLRVSQADYAFYEQNSYGISETVGLSFGIRYENQTNLDSRSNFAPRLGFIWSPKAKEKESSISKLPRVTMGVGIFYSRFAINNILSSFEADAGGRSYYFVTSSTILDSFPAVPSPATLTQFASLKSLRIIDPVLDTPRGEAFTTSVNKEIWRKITATVSYNFIDYQRVSVTRNVNAPLAGTFGTGAVPIYPNGTPGNLNETLSRGRNRIDGINLGVNFPPYKMFGRRTYISFYYAYQRSHGNAVSASGSSTDPYDFSREWGPNESDGTQRVSGFASLPLPWHLSVFGYWNLASGRRFNIVTGRDLNGDGYYAERPAFASDPSKPGVISTKYGLLDPSPGPGEPIIPRNLGRGPGHYDAGLNLSRTWGFHKDKANKNEPRQELSLAVQVQNVFNFASRSTPVGNMSSPYFLGSVQGYSFDGNYASSSPRKFVFSSTFSF